MLPEQIKTDRLTLRRFSLQDADAVFSYSSPEDWSRYQRIPTPYTVLDNEKFMAELVLRDWDNQPTWAITLDGGVIGIVGITFEAEHRIAVLGYGVDKGHWGNGFAGEGARAIVDHSFREYEQLKKIRAHTYGRNVKSTRVLQKLGFAHEGTLRSNQFAKGEFIDDVIYGILREEWVR